MKRRSCKRYNGYLSNGVLLFSVMCICNLVLPTYYEATHSWGSCQVDCKCNEIVLSHYPRKMICAVLDTWCCKLVSKFFIFYICCFISKFNKAYHMPNILRSRELRYTPFRENVYHTRLAFQRRSIYQI